MCFSAISTKVYKNELDNESQEHRFWSSQSGRQKQFAKENKWFFWRQMKIGH